MSILKGLQHIKNRLSEVTGVVGEDDEEGESSNKVFIACIVGNTLIFLSSYSCARFSKNYLYPKVGVNLSNLIKVTESEIAFGIVVILAIFSNCAVRTFYFEFVVAFVIFFISIASTILNMFGFDHIYTALLCWSQMVIQLSFCPTSIFFFLDQIRHSDFSLTIPLFLIIWGDHFLTSLMTLAAEMVAVLFGKEVLIILHTTTQLFFASARAVVLIWLWSHIYKENASLKPLFSLVVISSAKIRIFCSHMCRRMYEVSYPEKEAFYVSRFWAIMLIVLFCFPFGLVFHISKLMSKEYDVLGTSFLTNSNALYYFAASLLFPIYFFIHLWCKKISNLQHIIVSQVLISLAILCGAVLVYLHESHRKPLPSPEKVQIRIYNMIDSDVSINTTLTKAVISPHGTIVISGISTKDKFFDLEIKVDDNKNLKEKTSLVGLSGKSIAYVINEKGLSKLGVEPIPEDKLNITKDVDPFLIIVSSQDIELQFKNGQTINKKVPRSETSFFTFGPLPPGKYEIVASTKNKTTTLYESFTFNKESIYSLFIFNPNTTGGMKVFTLYETEAIKYWWIYPLTSLLSLSRCIFGYFILKFGFEQIQCQLLSLVISIGLDIQVLSEVVANRTALAVTVIANSLYIFCFLTFHLAFVALFAFTAIKYTPYSFTKEDIF